MTKTFIPFSCTKKWQEMIRGITGIIIVAEQSSFGRRIRSFFHR